MLTQGSDFAPFYWGTVDTKKVPGMLVSIFPNADDDGGLNNPSSLIKLTLKSGIWQQNSTMIAPQ